MLSVRLCVTSYIECPTTTNQGLLAYDKICMKLFTEQQQAEIVELNIQLDRVHAIVMVFLKVSISDLVGIMKGRKAICVLNNNGNLTSKPYWGNHFWSKRE